MAGRGTVVSLDGYYKHVCNGLDILGSGSHRLVKMGKPSPGNRTDVKCIRFHDRQDANRTGEDCGEGGESNGNAGIKREHRSDM